MIRTEDDLRACYANQPDTAAAETRVLSWWADLDTTAQARRGAMRAWAAAGASAAAVAALAVGAAVAIPHLQAHDRPTDRAGAVPATKAASGPATASTSRVPTSPATVTITPQVAVRTLISLLPRAGSTTRLAGQSGLGEVGGTLVYDDGHGAAELSVGMSYPFRYHGKLRRTPAGTLCTSQGVRDNHSPCTTLPDGAQLSVYKGDANVPAGATEWGVTLLRPDGVQINISEWNSPVEKGGPRTRDVPPFTIAELSTIVRSTKWQASVERTTALQAAGLFTPQHS